LPTLLTPPRPASGYSERTLHSRETQSNRQIAHRRAQIYDIHNRHQGSTLPGFEPNFNVSVEDDAGEEDSSILLGERSVSNTVDDQIYTTIKHARKKRIDALQTPNWGKPGTELPRELERLSITVKRSRPRTANPRVSDASNKRGTANPTKKRPVSAYTTVGVDDKTLPQVLPFETATSIGKTRRLDTLVREVDNINAINYKQRLRLFRYYKERQWHSLMRLATVMAKVRQDGDQGQRMFLALSSGFAASTSAPVTVEQFVSRCTSFGLPWWKAEPLLRTIFICFDDDFDGLMDWRDFVSALRIVVKPREPMSKRLRMFFNIYCDHTKFLKRDEIVRVFTVHVVSPQVAQDVRNLVENWLEADHFREGCHLDEISMFLRSKRAEATMRLLAEDWFRAMPDGLRFNIVNENYKDSERELKAVDDSLKMKKALGMWMGQINNTYFQRWRYAIYLIHCYRRGVKRSNRTARTRGLENWRVFLDRRKGNRVNRYAADMFRYRWLTMRVFRWWKIMYKFWLRRNAEYERRAIAMVELTRKEKSMEALKWYLEKRRKKRLAIEFWENFEMRNLIRTWRQNVTVILRQREAQEKSGALRAKMKNDEIKKDVEEALRLEIEERERQKAAEAKRKAEIEAEKELWAEQKMIAYERGEERRIRRLQREEWARLKAKAKKEHKELVDKMLDRLEITVRQQAEAEALDYMASPEGKKMIALEMQKVKKDGSWGDESMHAEGSPQPEEGEDPDAWNAKQMVWAMNNGIEMVKMVDAVVGEVFFYNVNTGARLSTDALSTQECRKVARKNYIDRKVNEALTAMRRQRDIDERNKLENKSSTIITNTFRILSCKRKLRTRAKEVFSLRSDPYSGEPYYLNTWTLETQTAKPYSLGKDVLALPEWIVIRDQNQPSTIYYKQTIEPFATQWEKPEGWIPCMRCQVEFAERRCRFCGFDEEKGGEVFCLTCFMEAHPKTEERPHPWKEVRRITTYCFMCRTRIAAKVCWECGCDCFCESHFKLMHTTKRIAVNNFANHTAYPI
jgi:hypothetical protein